MKRFFSFLALLLAAGLYAETPAEATAPAVPAVELLDGAMSEDAVNVEKITENGMTFLRFNGSDSFFMLPVPGGWRSFTVSMWTRPKSLNSGTVYSTTGANRQRLWIAPDGVMQYEMWEGGKLNVKWVGRLKANEWVHIAISYDVKAKIAAVYVNGKRTMRFKFQKPLAPVRGKLCFGKLEDARTKYPFFDGDLNRIRIFTTALSQDEVCGLLQQDEDAYSGVYKAPTVNILPAVAENALSTAEKADLKENFSAKLAAYQKKAATLKEEFVTLFGDRESLQKNRVGKRFEIFSCLVEFAKKNFDAGTNDGLFFAQQALFDMEALFDYFELEKKYYPLFPKEGMENVTVLNLADFGAVGDGVADDSPAFAKAIRKVKELKGAPAVIQIPAGKFLLKTPLSFSYDDIPGMENLLDRKSYTKAHLALGGIDNLTVQGAGAEKTDLIFGVYDLNGVIIGGCSNTTLKGVSLYWQENPFSLGTILELDKENKAYVIEHHPGTMKPDDPRLLGRKSWGSCTTYNADHKIQKVGLVLFDCKAEDLGGGKYKVYTDKRYFSEFVKPGQFFTIPDRNNWFAAVNMHNSLLCNLIDVTVRNSRAAAFKAVSSYPSYEGCRIYPVDGYYLSTNADGCISSVGTYAANCDFRAMSDDGFNLSGQGYILTEQSKDSITVGYQERVFRKGDRIFAVNPDNGQYAGTVEITGESIFDGKNLHTTPVAAPFPAAVSCEELGMSLADARNWGNVFAGTYKKDARPSMVFGIRTLGIGTVVTNCRIDNSSSSGLVIQAGPALIENNIVDNVAWQGIRVSSLLVAHEGPMPWCVIVKGNRFLTPHYGLITHASIKGRRSAPTAGIRGLVFENNLIAGAKSDMELENLGDAVICNNKITKQGATPAIRFSTGKNIRWEGNLFNGKPDDREDFSFSNMEKTELKSEVQ